MDMSSQKSTQCLKTFCICTSIYSDLIYISQLDATGLIYIVSLMLTTNLQTSRKTFWL